MQSQIVSIAQIANRAKVDFYNVLDDMALGLGANNHLSSAQANEFR